MAIRFEHVTLDSTEDSQARLVFRDDRLAAIVSQLGALHDGLAGQWFIEATFDSVLPPSPAPFATLDEVEAWIVRASH
jgi:hypothetical protein